MSEDLLLELRDLSVSIVGKKETLPIVKGIDLHIPRGSIVGLVGESGYGKSMTAKSINNILPPFARVTGGSIIWRTEASGEVDLALLKEKEMRKKCGTEIAMVFQEPMTSLNPLMQVGEQIKEVLTIHGVERDNKKAKDRVIEMLSKVGIAEPALRYNAWPHELSGGMRQRVMIAMAMICQPKLLIADEPTTALDVTIEAQILSLIKELCRNNSMSALVITHNMGVVSTLCDYVYVMYLGSVVESAPVKELFNNPCHPYTRGLLSSIPHVGDNPEFLHTIPGNVPDMKKHFKGCDFCLRCSDDIKQCFFEKPALTETGAGHFVRCHRSLGA